jgi:hypothetical protein
MLTASWAPRCRSSLFAEQGVGGIYNVGVLREQEAGGGESADAAGDRGLAGECLSTLCLQTRASPSRSDSIGSSIEVVARRNRRSTSA